MLTLRTACSPGRRPGEEWRAVIRKGVDPEKVDREASTGSRDASEVKLTNVVTPEKQFGSRYKETIFFFKRSTLFHPVIPSPRVYFKAMISGVGPDSGTRMSAQCYFNSKTLESA